MRHLGEIIREYRQRAGLTQAQLAARWPKSERFGGGEGVSWKYIQDIEHGRKRIEDPETLRKVCRLLDIPLWRVGLSDVDPFNGTLLSSLPFRQCMELMELTLREIWLLRKAALLEEARRTLTCLQQVLASFEKEIPPLGDERRFLRLLSDYFCTQGVLAIDARHYEQARLHYQRMYQLASQLNEPALLAHALMNLGVEFDRQGDTQRSLAFLEQARDRSFEAPKAWGVLVHSYLSRAYARAGEARRFQQANDTALRLSSSLATDFLEDADHVYYTVGQILAERSAGYLLIGQPRQTLALRQEISSVLQRERSVRVAFWMPLDWARAYLLLGEVEACVSELRVFTHQAVTMGAHALGQAHEVLEMLIENYRDVQVVRDLQEELKDQGIDTRDISHARQRGGPGS
jgi:transcriptional regulator with XRE-family HTH domain